MSLPSSLQMNSLYTNPQLLGQLFPNINLQAIQTAFQAQQVQAEQPLAQLNQQVSALSAPLQAWQKLQQDLQTLQTDAVGLAGASLYQQTSATASGASSLAVNSTGTPGTPGTYTIGPASGQSAVVLAQDEIVNAKAQTSETTALNLPAGSFAIDGKTVDVTPTDSLQTIAQSIDAAGAGVSAVILTPPGGSYVLSIQGKDATPMTFSDPNGILSGLGISLNGNGTAASPAQAARYAQYSVNGVDVTQGTSNTDASSIPGVSFTLLGTAGGTITVSQNTSAIQSAVQQFATDLNAYLGDSQKYTGKGGAIEGDGTISAINAQLMQILGSAAGGQPATMNSLGAIGLSLTAPVGSPDQFSLQVNTADLNSALQSDPTAFASLWNGGGGIATQLQSLLATSLGAQGGVTQAVKGLQQQQQNLDTQISDPNSAVNQVVNAQLAQLQTQFSNLMQSLTSLSTQGSMITQFTNLLSGQSQSSGGSTSSGG